MKKKIILPLLIFTLSIKLMPQEVDELQFLDFEKLFSGLGAPEEKQPPTKKLQDTFQKPVKAIEIEKKLEPQRTLAFYSTAKFFTTSLSSISRKISALHPYYRAKFEPYFKFINSINKYIGTIIGDEIYQRTFFLEKYSYLRSMIAEFSNEVQNLDNQIETLEPGSRNSISIQKTNLSDREKQLEEFIGYTRLTRNALKKLKNIFDSTLQPLVIGLKNVIDDSAEAISKRREEMKKLEQEASLRKPEAPAPFYPTPTEPYWTFPGGQMPTPGYYPRTTGEKRLPITTQPKTTQKKESRAEETKAPVEGKIIKQKSQIKPTKEDLEASISGILSQEFRLKTKIINDIKRAVAQERAGVARENIYKDIAVIKIDIAELESLMRTLDIHPIGKERKNKAEWKTLHQRYLNALKDLEKLESRLVRVEEAPAEAREAAEQPPEPREEEVLQPEVAPARAAAVEDIAVEEIFIGEPGAAVQVQPRIPAPPVMPPPPDRIARLIPAATLQDAIEREIEVRSQRRALQAAAEERAHRLEEETRRRLEEERQQQEIVTRERDEALRRQAEEVERRQQELRRQEIEAEHMQEEALRKARDAQAEAQRKTAEEEARRAKAAQERIESEQRRIAEEQRLVETKQEIGRLQDESLRRRNLLELDIAEIETRRAELQGEINSLDFERIRSTEKINNLKKEAEAFKEEAQRALNDDQRRLAESKAQRASLQAEVEKLEAVRNRLETAKTEQLQLVSEAKSEKARIMAGAEQKAQELIEKSRVEARTKASAEAEAFLSTTKERAYAVMQEAELKTQEFEVKQAAAEKLARNFEKQAAKTRADIEQERARVLLEEEIREFKQAEIAEKKEVAQAERAKQEKIKWEHRSEELTRENEAQREERRKARRELEAQQNERSKARKAEKAASLAVKEASLLQQEEEIRLKEGQLVQGTKKEQREQRKLKREQRKKQREQQLQQTKEELAKEEIKFAQEEEKIRKAQERKAAAQEAKARTRKANAYRRALEADTIAQEEALQAKRASEKSAREKADITNVLKKIKDPAARKAAIEKLRATGVMPPSLIEYVEGVRAGIQPTLEERLTRGRERRIIGLSQEEAQQRAKRGAQEAEIRYAKEAAEAQKAKEEAVRIEQAAKEAQRRSLDEATDVEVTTAEEMAQQTEELKLKLAREQGEAIKAEEAATRRAQEARLAKNRAVMEQSQAERARIDLQEANLKARVARIPQYRGFGGASISPRMPVAGPPGARAAELAGAVALGIAPRVYETAKLKYDQAKLAKDEAQAKQLRAERAKAIETKEKDEARAAEEKAKLETTEARRAEELKEREQQEATEAREDAKAKIRDAGFLGRIAQGIASALKGSTEAAKEAGFSMEKEQDEAFSAADEAARERQEAEEAERQAERERLEADEAEERREQAEEDEQRAKEKSQEKGREFEEYTTTWGID